MKALTILLSDEDQEERKVRKDEVSRPREGRQEGFEGVLGECEITGFEVMVREECEKGSEIQCEKVNVTKFRTEIVNKCKTLFDNKCEVTYNDVPTQKCMQKQKNK